MATEQQIIADAKKAFELAANAEHDNRQEALDDIKFAKLSQQWPDGARRQRELDNRPCLTINKLPAIIRQVTNDARQNKPSIKVHPADDGADVHTAEIYNGLIKNIEATSNADIAYDIGLDSAVTGGFGYWTVAIVEADDDVFGLDIKIKPVYNPFSVYGDPHSIETDGSDWNVSFIVSRMTKDDFGRKYKGAEVVDWDNLAYAALKTPWVELDEVMVAEYWTREEVQRPIVMLSDGTIMERSTYQSNKDLFDVLGLQVKNERSTKSYRVTQRIITGAEVLETNDWAGKYIPIVPVYGDDINVEGRRYFKGMVRDLKDPARMYNYWRSASTELVALAPKSPFIGPTGSFNTAKVKWQQANANSFPFIEYDPVPGQPPPARQPFAGPPAGVIQETMQAAEDLKAVSGLYDASMGASGNEISARAILARQREGDVSTFNYIDNVSRALRQTGRILIDLIPKVYNESRIIRILGSDGTPQNVPLKQPVTLPDGTQKVFDLSLGKYDLTVESGPSFTTRREEAANQMIDLIQAFPAIAPYITDLLAKALDWPEADVIAQRAKALLPQQLQGEDPQLQQAQQAIQQLKFQLLQSQQQVTALKMDKNLEADKLRIDAFEAETDRLKVTSPAMGPQEVQALVMQTIQQILNTPNPTPGSAGPLMPVPPGVVPGAVPYDPLSNSNPEQPHMAVPSH